jgi:hypothetical protein
MKLSSGKRGRQRDNRDSRGDHQRAPPGLRRGGVAAASPALPVLAMGRRRRTHYLGRSLPGYAAYRACLSPGLTWEIVAGERAKIW